MPIPDYQSLMLPLLKYIADGKEVSTVQAINHLSTEFKLTESELNEWLPSKKQKTFANRVHWAKAHLKMSGAIENLHRGYFKITQRGKMILDEKPPSVTVKYMMDLFADYADKINTFRGKKPPIPDHQDNTATKSEENIIEETPEELIESGYQKIRGALENEILSKLKTVDPSLFERIVVDLLVKMGYGGSIEDAGKAIGKRGDEGIDGIIKEDKLGLDIIYVQAKRWEGVVGRPELHKFVGALAGQGAKKGIFITTSGFTKEAQSYTPKNETKIILIDGITLSQYMIDYNLGVSTKDTYEVKKMDLDYFEGE